MKRFVLFAGPMFYPGGGMDDCIGEFDTHDEAVAHLKKWRAQELFTPSFLWAHVWDTHQGLQAVTTIDMEKLDD